MEGDEECETPNSPAPMRPEVLRGLWPLFVFQFAYAVVLGGTDLEMVRRRQG